jgi:hypothetical protein
MAILAASGLLAACTPDVEDYPRELEQAICEWQHACHVYERRSDCADALAIDSDPSFDYVRSAVAAGRIEYDGEAAASCFDAIRERNCEVREPAEEPSCAAALRGRMGRNGPCMVSAECAEGGVCGFDPSCSEQCCVGACRVQADPLEIGAACGGSLGCVDEGYCGVDPGGAMVCLPRVAVGGDCSLGQSCAEAAVCEGVTCRAVKTVKEGAQCDDYLVNCESPARCVYEGDAGQYCRVAPQLGAPCDPNGIGCARFDTFCDEASKRCVLRPGPGAGCDYECADYASCENLTDGGPSTCVALAGEGEACGHNDKGVYIRCLGVLECEGDQCSMPVREPEAVCPVPAD